MSKKRRFANRRADRNRRIAAMFLGWSQRAFTRPEHLIVTQLVELADELLLGFRRLSRADFVAEHRHRHGLTEEVAQAEIDSRKDQIMRRLRNDLKRLVHPLTELGWWLGPVDPEDRKSIAAAIPGLGSSEPTFGWRLAEGHHDPLYVAWEDSQIRRVNGGAARVEERSEIAARQGIVDAPLRYGSLPTTVRGGSADPQTE